MDGLPIFIKQQDCAWVGADAFNVDPTGGIARKRALVFLFVLDGKPHHHTNDDGADTNGVRGVDVHNGSSRYARSFSNDA